MNNYNESECYENNSKVVNIDTLNTNSEGSIYN